MRAIRRLNAPKGLGSAIFPDPSWAEVGRSLGLTKRELQIVRGIFDDRTEFAIAAELGISPHTVHTHMERLRHKLAVVDRVALVLHVMEEFLRLTTAPRSRLPPICGIYSAGLCHLRD
jgi:DNA-binding CsgD family transcriptional regulator